MKREIYSNSETYPTVPKRCILVQSIRSLASAGNRITKKKKKKEATNLEDVQADDQILGALATPLANVRLRQLHHQLLVVVRYVEAILRR